MSRNGGGRGPKWRRPVGCMLAHSCGRYQPSSLKTPRGQRRFRKPQKAILARRMFNDPGKGVEPTTSRRFVGGARPRIKLQPRHSGRAPPPAVETGPARCRRRPTRSTAAGHDGFTGPCRKGGVGIAQTVRREISPSCQQSHVSRASGADTIRWGRGDGREKK